MNRLARESSPYLLQHAANPVDWWPWCDEALAAAREQDKPILLSIGYSACHWCHVMAHESFEDEDTAALMNAQFINIKVDREERPDLDQIYQTAHQMMTRRGGGWPLTMFLAPDGTPFFGGTYFPREPRYGMPAFADVLQRVAATWGEQREVIAQQNTAMHDALRSTLPQGALAQTLGASPIAEARDALLANFDARYGGFGRAPKFPHAADLALLRDAACDGDEASRQAFLHTLRCMARGGLYDQLGGGFSRYSVDDRWHIPHFEKMLYDNGLLLALYADAWAMTREPLFRRAASGTAQWAMREMQSPEGGYYAALDADSEGVEGRYYVWQREEIENILDDAATRNLVIDHFGLDEPPNFEGEFWHLHVTRPLEEIVARHGMTLDEGRQRMDAAIAALLAQRQQRVAPGRDDKLLAGWNGMMISGMAHASMVFDEPAWLASAQRAMDFVQTSMWRDGRLFASCKNGHAHLNAYLDDHAFLLDAALALLQAEFRRADLDFASRLAGALLADFEDKANGGFHFTRHDHERLILRPKSGHDAAIPAGNGVAAFALQRYGHLVGDMDCLRAAERTLRLFYPDVAAAPMGYSAVLAALAEYLEPPTVVILRGESREIGDWHRRLAVRARPHELHVTVPASEPDLPLALDKPLAERPAAWVCRGTQCLPPVHDLSELERLLDAA